MADLSRTISVPGFTDWVYDPQRNQIHIVTGDGSLYSWGMAEQRLVSSLHLGGSPVAVDIAPDGSFLLVANRDLLLTSGPFAFEKTYAALLTEVNLSAGTVQRHQFTPGFGEGGVGDVAIGADGKGLITTYYQGSGWTPLREFDPVTDTFTRISGVGRINSLPASSGTSSHLIMSEDRRYVFIQEANISDGAMHVYDTLADSRLGGISLYDFNSSGFQSGLGDISTEAGLVVDVLYSSVYVFSLAMRPVANISTYASAGSIAGAEFNDGGHQLFLWRGGQKSILVLDTLTWMPVGSISVSSTVSSGYVGQGWGGMDVLGDGRFLALDLGGGLELIDLSARLQINITGDATDQTLHGAIGADSLAGGAGADTVTGYAGQDYLRGDDGADSLSGGADFDDINGNAGDDTASGGAGDDWVVGGKDNDRLAGDAGDDIVYGNLGDDTCDGGDGADIVRGGQGADVVLGGAGADWLSGDRGDDTVTGGAGADIFHSFAEAGLDRVTDFNFAEGDRVQLDPGTQYTLAQVGADTVVSMGGGNQLVLVNVQLSSLPSGWIIGG